MSNALQAFASTAVSVDNIDAAVNRGVANAPPVPSMNPYLRLDQRTGCWLYGQENIVVQDDAVFAINIMSFQHGYVCWSDPQVTRRKAELLGEKFVRFDVDLPPHNTLPDHSDQGGAWRDAVMFELVMVEGEDEGQQVIYNASSLGGCRAYGDLLTAVQGRPVKTHPFPLVKLRTTSYESKYGSTVHNPIFEIVGWGDTDGNRVSAKGGPAVTKAVEPQPDAPAQADPPRRRRREAGQTA